MRLALFFLLLLETSLNNNFLAIAISMSVNDIFVHFCVITFQVSMTVGDGGKTYFISGQWDPTIRDLLVLNTETPKGVSVTTFRIFFLFQPFHYKQAQICTMLGRLEGRCLMLKN